jgi:hypothetical protein
MLGKFGICTSLLDMEPPRDKALPPPPHLELPISEFHACINAIQQYMHQSHDWEQTRVQSPVPAKIFNWDFSRFKYFERFPIDCCNGKKWFEGQQITWHCGKCYNPATGKVSFVNVWLSSKAINALWADSQFRPKFKGRGNPRGDLPRYKEDILSENQ